MFVFLAEFFQEDERTNLVNKRDYFNLMKITGLYPEISRKNVHWIILQYSVTFSILTFFGVQIMTGTVMLSKYNFNMATYLFQYGVLVTFTILVVVVCNLKRKSYTILHREMIYEILKYETEDREVIDGLMVEMRNEKKQLLAFPVFVFIVAVNATILGPIIDSTYGELDFSKSDVPLNWDLPIPIPFPISSENLLASILGYLVEGASAYLVGSIMCSAGLICLNISQYFCLHLKYLAHNISNIQNRALTLYSMVYSERKKGDFSECIYYDMKYMNCYKVCLKRSIIHHQQIMR